MIKLRVKPHSTKGNRKRSSAACSACRCRKVRCDVSAKGAPCTTCNFYNVHCTIPVDRRGKFARETQSAREADPSTPRAKIDTTANTVPLSETPAEITRNDQDPQFWVDLNTKSEEALENSIYTRTRPVTWSNYLPCYSGPLSPAITRQDCKALHRAGVFDVPDTRVRDELLRNYCQFVHPALPVLDLERFLMVIDGSYQGTEGISFLLFQAVMFAASAFETRQSVELEAFENRREIRKIRFEKVRTLYVSACEEDRISNLQTVLLMTMWDCSSDDGPSASKYISIAKAILKSIEISPTESETRMIKENPGFWKRLQWCVYIRDRLTALTLQCTYQIDEETFNVPMLKAADLQLGPLSTKSCLGANGSHPAIRDPSMRGLLSQIPVYLALFCKWVTPIISLKSVEAQSIQHWMYLNTGPEILLRDSELKEWQNTLPEALKWIRSSPLTGINKHGDVVLFFRAMLNGLFHLACYGLHKSRVNMVDPSIPELTGLSRKQMRSAVSEMTDIYRFFRSKSFIYELPDVQVPMLEICLSSNLSDFSSPVPFVRQSAIEGFQLCAQGLQQMGDTYPAASRALATINARISARADENKSKELDDTRAKWQNSHIAKNRGHHSQVNDWLDRSGTTTSQQIERFDITETSALLTSHFMMTSFEKDFLQDLSSPETVSPDSVQETFGTSQEPNDGISASAKNSPDWKDSAVWSLDPTYGSGGLMDWIQDTEHFEVPVSLLTDTT